MTYIRALVRSDPVRPSGAFGLGGGELWFSDVEVLSRNAPPEVRPASDAPAEVLARLTAPRPPLAGLDMTRPQIMGILNVTPDSFSDGGRFTGAAEAQAHAAAMVRDGAALIDVGGESTRPGAETVEVDTEIARTAPVIAALVGSVDVPLSIDTRKAPVARAALDAGAAIVNDVSGFTFDPDLAPLCAERGVPVCVMHAQGDPRTMQNDPRYDDVLLDVYDALSQRVDALEALGLPRGGILVDPGIGFGKTLEHNLALLNRISLFHSLGCPVLLGASRKRFIGTISGVQEAAQRVSGSVAVALAGIAQGVQIVRVHDVAETAQALALWRAVARGAA